MAISLERGVFSVVLGLGGTGAVMMWPEQWWIGVALIVAAVLFLLWGVRINGNRLWQPWWRRRLPERHTAILHNLASPLARVQELSMVYGQRDLSGIAAAKAEAEGLVAQIPYDQDTSQTVRDFLNVCGMIVSDFQMHCDERENRGIAQRMSIGLFRYLHDGKPVDRRKIELPDWCPVVVCNKDAVRKPEPSIRGDPVVQAIPATPRPNEYSRAFRQSTAEQEGQTARVPFSEVVRRVAYYSDWADEFEDYDYDIIRHLNDPWKLLLREICRPLTIGDIDTWGVKNEHNKEAENGPTPIKASFWTRAYFAPELMLIEPSIGSANYGELRLTYTEIVFDRAGVERTWPLAHRDGKPSPFEKIYAKWRAKWDEDHRQHADWVNRPQEEAERRRELIAKGRNVVHRFRQAGVDQDFEIVASQDRDYLDIQPHLGDEYQRWRTRTASTIFQTLGGGGDHRAAIFLRELARLEKEWGLV